MHATNVLDTCLPTVCQTMHAARFTAVKVAVESAIKHQCVSVTGLGRGIDSDIDERYDIKRMDRLIGNTHLQEEIPLGYESMTQWLLGQAVRPLTTVSDDA